MDKQKNEFIQSIAALLGSLFTHLKNALTALFGDFSKQEPGGGAQ